MLVAGEQTIVGPLMVKGPLGMMGIVATVATGQVAGVHSVVASERDPAGPAPQFTVTQVALLGPCMVPVPPRIDQL